MTNVIENSLVTGILFLIIIVPIILVSRRAKQKRLEKSREVLHALALRNQLQLNKSDLLGHNALGLDSSKNVLIYVNTQSQELISKTDLSRVSHAGVIKKTDNSTIVSIQLVLQAKEQNLTSISFYQQFQDDEMKIKQFQQLAKSWKQEINQLLKQRKTA